VQPERPVVRGLRKHPLLALPSGGARRWPSRDAGASHGL